MQLADLLSLIDKRVPRSEGKDDAAGRSQLLESVAVRSSVCRAAEAITRLQIRDPRHRSVIGLGLVEQADLHVAVAAQIILDMQTGLVSIAKISLVQTGAFSAIVLENAIVEALGLAFGWASTAEPEIQRVIGVLGFDAHVASAVDVPDMEIALDTTVRSRSVLTANAAAAATMQAILDALEQMGIEKPALPIEADSILLHLFGRGIHT